MQSFIGVKIVQAVPAKQEGKDGYKVIYPDGYESWSPKEVFEKVYLPLEDPSKITPSVVNSFLGNTTATKIDGKTTLVKAETITGFVQYEASSCVDPENYNHEIGTAVGVERIKENLWKCLGFVLQWGKNGMS